MDTKKAVIPRDMSIDEFVALYAPASFDFVPNDKRKPHDIVMESLQPCTQELVTSARRLYSSPDEYEIRITVNAYSANKIDTQSQAARYIKRMEEAEDSLQKALRQINALKAYYGKVAELMAATQKYPAYVLDRIQNRYGDAKVYYEIHKGFYDVTLHKLVVQDMRIEKFDGKEHRNARARFAELVKSIPGCRGYESNNGYFSGIAFDDAKIVA